MSFRSGVALILLLAGGCTRQSPAPEQANAQANVQTADEAAPTVRPPLAVGAVDRSHKGEAAPAGALTDLAGKAVTLAAFKDKPVLVNLWATWCAPCIAEMPTLDRAAQAVDGKVAVIALNQGDDAAKVQAFLAGKPLAHARPLLDKAMTVSVGFGANLPTTILYDGAGKEVWRATGGRDWASADSLKLIGEAG